MRFPTGLETSTFRREGHGDFNGTPTDESLKMINSNVQTPRAVHRNEEGKKGTQNVRQASQPSINIKILKK